MASASRVAITAWSTKAPRSRSIAAAALGEHGGQAAGLLAERLEAHERVAEVVAAGVAELGLGGEHRGVELGEGAAQEVVLGGQLGAGGGAVGEAAA